MSLETTVTYIDSLVTTWPDGSDARSTADNHLRNIKASLRRTFPNITGEVSVSHGAINLAATGGTLRNDLSVGASLLVSSRAVRYDITPAETAAGVTIVDFTIPNHLVCGFAIANRYGANTTPGTTNMTAAIQAALTVGVQAKCPAALLGEEYLANAAFSMADGAQLVGTHNHKYPAGGSLITFAPASALSLFVASGAPAAFRYGYSIRNLRIVGNSANSSGNSVYAIDAHGWNNALIENVNISGFRTPIREYATIDNTYRNVKLGTNYIQQVLFDGGTSTTSLWDRCYLGTAPIGVQTNGTNFAHIFRDCIWESFTTYGMNIVRESYGFEVQGGYCEDGPSANVATNAMFRVGYDGTTLAGGGTQLIVRGGTWAGRNAGAIGSCLDVDYTDGVEFYPSTVMRYTNAIETTANTQTSQILVEPFIGVSLSSIVTDNTKVIGMYPNGTFSSGTRNNQLLRVLHAYVGGRVTIDSAAAAGTGTELVLGKGTQATVGAAGGASALPATPTGYLRFFIGATEYVIPYYAQA